MTIENDTLYLEDYDCDHIQGDIDNGLTVQEAFENQVMTLGGRDWIEIKWIERNGNYPELFDALEKVCG